MQPTQAPEFEAQGIATILERMNGNNWFAQSGGSEDKETRRRRIIDNMAREAGVPHTALKEAPA